MGRLLLSFKYTQAFNRRPMITLTFNLLTLSDALCRKRETFVFKVSATFQDRPRAGSLQR